ncbi:hypothetical protein BIY27_16910 [Gibbsiella quercinecans]|uniref:DUF2057 family protein n=1 Tax=Gibbsiella quercinecans TaxID=929813 RepID=UPI000EF27603|nr:DUF2057 family protein [Gibbsiella quercinecans]RLM08495.1 hypothetical protein BIY27_16910 [Gibbsiella quercinecans]
MKFGLVVAGLLSLWLSAPAVATTLKLSPDIDLLVVDGRQMTGSLLKGADRLELDSGEHQLLFKVVKTVTSSSHGPITYTSQPLIVTFNAHNTRMVSFELPRIDSARDGLQFNHALNYQLVDDSGKKLATKNDKLAANPGADLEKTMIAYNGQKHAASVPAFAHLRASTPIPPPGVTPPGQKSITLKEAYVSEQMLQYWFQQADRDTQKRFLRWANQYTENRETP